MSAGTSIAHSEFNHSEAEQLHFLQVCIVPERHVVAPRRPQSRVSADSMRGKLQLIISPDG